MRRRLKAEHEAKIAAVLHRVQGTSAKGDDTSAADEGTSTSNRRSTCSVPRPGVEIKVEFRIDAMVAAGGKVHVTLEPRLAV